MKCYIRTTDNKYWVGTGGEFITTSRKEREVYDDVEFAKWFIENTNLFGELKIVYGRNSRSTTDI